MNRFLAAIVIISPLVLIGALTVAHGQSTGQAATAGNPAGDRDSYDRHAKERMRDWQAKVDAFSARVANKGAQAGTATENGLQKAWAKTQAEAQRLQSASADGWNDAKNSFEKASSDLSDAWDKVKPKED